MTSMLDSDWLLKKMLRSDWLGPIGASLTTNQYSKFQFDQELTFQTSSYFNEQKKT